VTRTAHSPPLTGTFSLLVNNVPLQISNNVNIPYAVNSWEIAYALNNLYQTR
jgi:hypothetical protein